MFRLVTLLVCLLCIGFATTVALPQEPSDCDRLTADGGTTILVTTQYVSEAEYCDAVALISDGELVAHATPANLRKFALGGEVQAEQLAFAAEVEPIADDGWEGEELGFLDRLIL